jgi:hypothetical protein
VAKAHGSEIRPICFGTPLVLGVMGHVLSFRTEAIGTVFVTLGITLAALSFACGSGTPPRRAEAVPHQPPSTDHDATIDLELRDAALSDALAILAGAARINLFADSHLDEAGRVTMAVHSVRWDEALARIAADHRLRVERLDVRGAERPAFWISSQSGPPAPRTSFRGERITAQFDDTPIRDVAKALSNVAKTEITVDDDVQASITLHMRLPWELALYHLAQKYDLRVVRSEGEIRISRP